MIEVKFRETGERHARGRNDWFTPAWAWLLEFDGRVRLEVYSKRAPGSPPIVVELQPGDARALAKAITKVAGGKA